MATATQNKMGQKVKLLIAQNLMVTSIVVLVSFLILGWLLLFSPELRKIRNANVSKSLESERVAKAAYLADLGNLAEKYIAIDSENLQNLDIFLPKSQDIPALLAMFEAAAANSDVSLVALNFSAGELDGAAASLKDIEAMNVSVSIGNASYTRFKLFLESLETNLRLFDIRSIDMSPSDASYELSIRTYARSSGKTSKKK